MAFNTGNSLGSTDPRDLSDNSENFDQFTNGLSPSYTDRLGNLRKSFSAMESEFAAFIASSGYEFLGTYGAGITITGYQQVVQDVSGEFWRLSGLTSLPYTTTGAGLPEGGAFVAVGDATLRQDLVQPVATYNSVGEMTLDGTLGVERKVRTLGYYTPGDGGGNDYEIVAGATGTADGGSFIDLDNGLQAKGLFTNSLILPEQFGAKETGDQITVLQTWVNFLAETNYIGMLGPKNFDFGGTLVFAGTGINIISSSLSFLRYTGSGDGILLTGTRHKISFGTVTVDIGTAPATRNIVTYRDLNRSQINIDRLGSNSGSAIKYDGPNATANTGDNWWYIHNGETGGSDYAINLSSSPTFGCEGENFKAAQLFPTEQAIVHCGDSITNDTVRYNTFEVALFGSKAGVPYTPRLAEFFNSFNTLYMGAWTEALNEEFFFAPATTDNYVISRPGLQRGGREEIRVTDGGRNYFQRYKNHGDTQGDDTVRSFRPQRQYGILEIYAEKRGFATITFDFDGEVAEVITSGGATTFNVYAGELTGTTGLDGSINIGINNLDKNIYIENRSNLTRTITYSVRGFL